MGHPALTALSEQPLPANHSGTQGHRPFTGAMGNKGKLVGQKLPLKVNLRAVQLLLGHTKLESTVRYLGVKVDDALAIAESTEI